MSSFVYRCYFAVVVTEYLFHGSSKITLIFCYIASRLPGREKKAWGGLSFTVTQRIRKMEGTWKLELITGSQIKKKIQRKLNEVAFFACKLVAPQEGGYRFPSKIYNKIQWGWVWLDLGYQRTCENWSLLTTLKTI